MKKILIVIRDMKIGGAQKSLLSFLQSLSPSQAGREVELHLMVIHPYGPFLPQIPDHINLVKAPKELLWISMPMCSKLLRYLSVRSTLGELCWLLRKFRKSSQHIDQQKWACWKPFVPNHSQKYDVAISYIDGCPNYYVMDKVQADKKVLWVHSDYQKQAYDSEFDRPFFEKSDAIVTISDQCRQSIVTALPQMAEKVHVLENITASDAVVQKSEAGECPEFADAKGLKLLTVGRLHPQKGIDLAVGAAKLLKEAGIPFLWLVAGEGAQRADLQKMIDDSDLSQYFQLLGSRENPYAYMAKCDMMVQPSRVEGKSIVLDEAKILCKPIVVTNYATVRDAVVHGQTGWIVDMDARGICEGILHLYRNPQLCRTMTENLRKMPKGNEEELERYVKIMF